MTLYLTPEQYERLKHFKNHPHANQNKTKRYNYPEKEIIIKIIKLRQQNQTYQEISIQVDVPISTVCRYVNRWQDGILADYGIDDKMLKNNGIPI